MAQMIDWQKDAVKSMWFLSEYERKMRGCKLTDDERREVEECSEILQDGYSENSRATW